MIQGCQGSATCIWEQTGICRQCAILPNKSTKHVFCKLYINGVIIIEMCNVWTHTQLSTPFFSLARKNMLQLLAIHLLLHVTPSIQHNTELLLQTPQRRHEFRRESASMPFPLKIQPSERVDGKWLSVSEEPLLLSTSSFQLLRPQHKAFRFSSVRPGPEADFSFDKPRQLQ